MAFDSLQEKITKSFRNIQGKGKLTEKNMEDTLKEIRVALLEADVNYGVVKNFLKNVQEKSIGQDVLNSINPSELLIKIVNDEIIDLLGGNQEGINYKEHGITTIMVVGLQGTGKTTTVGKLAYHLQKTEKARPLLIAGDIYRPAAVDQLKQIGDQIKVPVYSEDGEKDVAKIVQDGLAEAEKKMHELFCTIQTFSSFFLPSVPLLLFAELKIWLLAFSSFFSPSLVL